MVTAWGMSERLGPVNYQTTEEHPFLGKEIHEHREFSEHTAQMIDEEVAVILHGAASRATDLLTKNRERLENLTTSLQEKEELEQDEIEAILGPSVNFKPSRNGQPVHLDDGMVETRPEPAASRNGDTP
jgi:cell division protease FtsH